MRNYDIPKQHANSVWIFENMICFSSVTSPQKTKPRASVERLREASKIFEDFNIAQSPAHVNPQKHRFRISLTLRPLAYAPRRIVRLSRVFFQPTGGIWIISINPLGRGQ